MNRAKKNLHEAFWSKVDRADMGCWEWSGWVSPDGYGIFNDSSIPTRSAHRVSYLLSKGPIDQGMQICHACGNRRCVKPTHLYMGTAKHNATDGIRASGAQIAYKYFALRVSKNEKRTVEERAKNLNMTVSAYIRHLCGLPKSKPGRPAKKAAK
jgi:hypothetical protein